MSIDSARLLRDLLSPLTVAELVSTYWGRRSLHVPGSSETIAALGLDRDAFLEALRPSARRGDGGIKAQYFDAEGDHVEIGLRYGDPELVGNLLAAGMTICATDFDRRHERIGALAAAVAEALGAPEPFDASCYVSGHRRGFGLHFDSVPVLVVQCEGRKRWWYGETPAVPEPESSLVATNSDHVASFARRLGRCLDVPSDAELVERTLAPGDVLFLPAGTWHRTEADEHSLGVTFTLAPRRADAAIVDAIQTCVEDRMEWEPRVDHGGAEPLGAWRLERARAIQRRVASLDPEQIVAVLTGARPTVQASAGPEAAEIELDSTTALGVLPRSEVSVFTRPDEEGGRLLFVCGRDEQAIAIEPRYGGLVEEVLRRRELRAADAVPWLHGADWESTRPILHALVEIGVLTPRPAPG